MHNLTIQEKVILLFIISSLILGLGIRHFKKTIVNLETEVYQPNFDKDANLIVQAIKKSKQVNINTADIEELSTLPGVGKIIAGRIIDYRNTHDLFIDKEDIKKVKGIGHKKFEKMEEFILLE